MLTEVFWSDVCLPREDTSSRMLWTILILYLFHSSYLTLYSHRAFACYSYDTPSTPVIVCHRSTMNHHLQTWTWNAIPHICSLFCHLLPLPAQQRDTVLPHKSHWLNRICWIIDVAYYVTETLNHSTYLIGSFGSWSVVWCTLSC